MLNNVVQAGIYLQLLLTENQCTDVSSIAFRQVMEGSLLEPEGILQMTLTVVLTVIED